MARALLIGIVILLFSSCYDKGDCLFTNSSYVILNFKKVKNGVVSDSSVIFTSIEVMNSDSVLGGGTSAFLALPVDPTKTEAGFIIHSNQVVLRTDTNPVTKDTIVAESYKIRFSYRNETVIPTVNCEAAIYQKDVTIIETTYDTARIRIISNQLNRNATNVQILL